MLNKANFITIITSLSDMFGKPISEFMLDVYFEALKDYEDTQVKSAVFKCLKNYKYNTLPKPADILEYLEGSPSDKSLIAWVKAKEAVSKGGYVASIKFDDPIISHCLQELGGWQWFCSVPIDELPFVEKRFRDLYNMFRKREITAPVKIIGFIENKNSNTGYFDKIPSPVKIGFKEEKKKLVNTVTERSK